MMAARFRRSPPGGTPIGLRDLLRLLRERDPFGALGKGLGQLIGRPQITFYASGREALRVAFREFAQRSGRNEVVIPAYTCFSVPAAAVAAGLRVRLVDVGPNAWIDPDALGRLSLDRAAAVVVCNLFGIPEPTKPIADLVEASGAVLIDDAAQALGGRGIDGPAGGRGAVGMLSFGRGKPLSALGGGALAWEGPGGCEAEETSPRPRPWRALARAGLYDVALSPLVFPWLAAIPGLRIGETIYDPEFPQGDLDGASLALASALVSGVVRAGRERAAAAEVLGRRVAAETRFQPLLAPAGCEAVYPRLALLAPGAAARERAIVALHALGCGASPMYPSALDQIEALRPHLAGGPVCANAQDLSARLLTVPLSGGRDPRRLNLLLEGLALTGQ